MSSFNINGSPPSLKIFLKCASRNIKLIRREVVKQNLILQNRIRLKKSLSYLEFPKYNRKNETYCILFSVHFNLCCCYFKILMILVDFRLSFFNNMITKKMTGFGHILDSKFHVFLEKFFQGAKAALPCNFVTVSGTKSLFFIANNREKIHWPVFSTFILL